MSAEQKPEVESEEDTPKKTSMIVQVVLFLLITGLAAGAGFGVSMFTDTGVGDNSMHQAAMSGDEAVAVSAQQGDAGANGEIDEDDEGLKQAYARPLAPILTNLAAPDDVWVRLELAVVGEANLPEPLLEQIHQDLFAYMRTVKLHHVEGPSGYKNLKAELSERAHIRSAGAARAVLVRTLVFE